VTHLVWENHTLWQQGPRGVFQDRTVAAGLNAAAWRGTGFGATLADFDLDGANDLAFVNGLIKRGDDPAPRLAGLAAFWSPYAQRNQLFVNDGRGNFRDVSGNNPAFSGSAAVGRGLLSGDLDNDGALDLIACSAGGPARVFRNVSPRRGHWLSVRAVEPAHGGRDAHGAEIFVQSGARQWWRLIQPGTGYLVSNDPRAHFGLGEAATFDSIRVLWPDGVEEFFPGAQADQALVIRQGTGRTK
jgi:enediyne biosynthesis protein E4